MAVPRPNSPDAKRAAQKVRNVFYMIAAANLVIIAIVLWPRPKLKHPPKPVAADVSAAAELARDGLLEELEAVHDRLLAAYHRRDGERFKEEFSSAAEPRVDEEYFRAVVIAGYQEAFGELRDKKLTGETRIERDEAVLVHEVVSKKAGPAKSRATFRREAGKMRLVQWQLEKP